MGRFIIRRLLFSFLVLFIISLIVFTIFYAVPSDPARNFCGKFCTEDQVQAIRERTGLDRPIVERYVNFAVWDFRPRQKATGAVGAVASAAHTIGIPGQPSGLVTGYLGESFRNRQPVRETLVARLPTTASLALGAAVIWILVSIPIGVLAATRPRSVLDRIATLFALFFLSFPSFVLGLFMLYFLFYQLTVNAGLRWFPGGLYVPFTQDPLQWARHLILPWLTLALLYIGQYSRITRGSLLEVLGEDYIRTARAKGLRERRVVYRHGLRSALTPVVTLLGVDFGTLLGGAIVTEQIFSLQGIGKLAVESITTQDQPVIIGVVLLAAFFITIANVIVDILYAFLDSRVRLS